MFIFSELARILMIGGYIYETLNENLKSQDCFKESLFIAEKYVDVPLAQTVIGTAKEKIKK